LFLLVVLQVSTLPLAKQRFSGLHCFTWFLFCLPGMAYSQNLPPPPGEQGLVPVVQSVYAAPRGNYASMKFLDAWGCKHTAPHHDETVRALVAHKTFYDFSLVKAAANTACSPWDVFLSVGLTAAQLWGYTPNNVLRTPHTPLPPCHSFEAQGASFPRSPRISRFFRPPGPHWHPPRLLPPPPSLFS